MKEKHLFDKQDFRLLRLIQSEVRKRLRPNARLTAWLLIAKFVFYAGLCGLSYVGLFWISHPLLFMLNFIIYGLLGILLAFNFAHDLSHNTVFKSPHWNNLAYTCIYTLLGAHAEEWKHRHVHSHHFAPNVKDYDTDLSITTLIRVEPQSKHFWYHRYQHLYAPFAYTTYSLFWIFVKDFVMYAQTAKKGKNIAYHASFWLQKCFYLAYLVVLPLCYAAPAWQWVLLSFLVMHLVQSLFLLFTFFITHHVEGLTYPSTDSEGFIQTSWVRNQIESSNDFYPFSFWANFIFGGFNNHIAHHIFPQIHSIHYPELSKILYDVLQQEGIKPHHSSYWGGVASHLRHLRALGREEERSTKAEKITVS